MLSSVMYWLTMARIKNWKMYDTPPPGWQHPGVLYKISAAHILSRRLRMYIFCSGSGLSQVHRRLIRGYFPGIGFLTAPFCIYSISQHTGEKMAEV